MRRRLGLGVAWCCAALLAGCPQEASPPGGVDAGSVSAPSPAPGAPVQVGAVRLRGGGAAAAAVQRRVEVTLLGQPGFAAPGAAGAWGAAEVSGAWSGAWRDPRDGSGQVLGTARVELRLKMPTPRPSGVAAEYRAEALVGEALPDVSRPEAGVEALVLRVVEETTLSLVKQVRVDRADDGALVRLLGEGDVETLEFAVDAARSRRLKAASPALVRLLGHADRAVVNRAAAALGVVGDRSAVGPLIEAGSRVEALDRLPVIFALGEIGGPEAIAYLEALQGSAEVEPRLGSAVESALARAREQQSGGVP